jgi:pathogenesis-related protein 1
MGPIGPAQLTGHNPTFVNLHNAVCAAVGVGPVSWDDKVANYVLGYATERGGDCMLACFGRQYGYGENLFRAPRTNSSAADAVGSWVSEKQYYDHDTNSSGGQRGSRASTTRRWCGATPLPSAAPIEPAATSTTPYSSAATTRPATWPISRLTS